MRYNSYLPIILHFSFLLEIYIFIVKLRAGMEKVRIL